MGDGFGAFLIMVLVAIAAIILGAFAIIAERKRREAMRALAARLGWSYSPSRRRDHDERYGHFEIFKRGHSRSAFNTLRGQLDVFDQVCPALAGDFQYKVTRGSGKNRRTSTYTFSYLIVHLPFAHLPDTIIRPEGMFDRVAGVFGFDDIDFESEEFSRSFYVKSKSKRFAYDVVDARMMEFLLATRPPTVDVERARLCLSDGQSRWDPPEFADRIAWVTAFFERWPAHVVDQLRTSASM